MSDLFSDFLGKPSAATYLNLRDAMIEDPSFDLFSDALSRLEGLVAQDQHDTALALVPAMMPNWLLSPRAHQVIAMAALGAGETERAKREAVIAQACLAGLTDSGDGTEDDPYRPLHVSDEADVLDHLAHVWSAQRQDITDGRICDVITDSKGREHWFDMTDSLLAMSRESEGGPADGR
jgi:hypothetical protein